MGLFSRKESEPFSCYAPNAKHSKVFEQFAQINARDHAASIAETAEYHKMVDRIVKARKRKLKEILGGVGLFILLSFITGAADDFNDNVAGVLLYVSIAVIIAYIIWVIVHNHKIAKDDNGPYYEDVVLNPVLKSMFPNAQLIGGNKTLLDDDVFNTLPVASGGIGDAIDGFLGTSKSDEHFDSSRLVSLGDQYGSLFENMTATHTETTRDSDGNKTTKTVTDFKGTVLKCSINNWDGKWLKINPSGKTRYTSGRKYISQEKSHRIQTEDIYINENFNIWTNGELQARKALSPRNMEVLHDWAGRDLSILINGNELVIAWDNDETLMNYDVADKRYNPTLDYDDIHRIAGSLYALADSIINAA